MFQLQGSLQMKNLNRISAKLKNDEAILVTNLEECLIFAILETFYNYSSTFKGKCLLQINFYGNAQRTVILKNILRT